MAVELHDVAPGLWLWRQPHPAWEEGNAWDPQVAVILKPDHVRDGTAPDMARPRLG